MNYQRTDVFMQVVNCINFPIIGLTYSQMLLSSCFPIINLLILFQITVATSTAPSFSANYKSTLTGKYVFNIADQILQMNSTFWSPASAFTFTFTFPDTIYNTDVLCKVILADFECNNVNAGISATVYLLECNKTNMRVQIFSSNASNIKKLSMAYLIFYNNYKYLGNIAVYHKSLSLNKTISNISSASVPIPLPSNINITGGLSIFTVLGGLDVYPLDNATNTIDITNQLSAVDSSNLLLTVSSRSNSPTYISSLSLVTIIYNKGFLFSDSSDYVRLQQGAISLPVSGSVTYTNSSQQITSFNVLLGILSFGISNQNSFSFSTEFIQPDTFKITSGTVFDYATFEYAIIYINYCDYKTLYLYNSICYDICPTQTASNSSTLQCNYQPSTSGSPFPGWAIAVIVVSSAFTITITAAFIYLWKRKRQQSQRKNQDIKIEIVFTNQNKRNATTDAYQNNSILDINQINIISLQDFQKNEDKESPRKKNSIPLIDQKNIEEINMHVEPPRHQPMPDQKPMPQLDREASVRKQAAVFNPIVDVIAETEEWMADGGKLQAHQETCCICLKERPFLRSSCTHQFHLTCLLRWREKQSHCPLCREQISVKARFYCKNCGKFYKQISLDSVDPKAANFKVVCDNCPI